VKQQLCVVFNTLLPGITGLVGELILGLHPTGHGLCREEQGMKMGCTLLLSARSQTPPSRCFVFTYGSKSSWKGFFFSLVWRFFQHKIISW